MKRIIMVISMVTVLALFAGTTLVFAETGKGFLFYNGEIVRTVVPPSKMPKEGTDNFYAVTNGLEGQLGVAAVAPGDTDYHGGHWAYHEVTWNVEPDKLLKSEQDVLDADVTITRVPSMDFLCPIQPLK